MESIGTQLIVFVIQIVLARKLAVSEYGAIAIMMIFVALANVFINQGFSTALVQNKDVTESDYSSVLFVSVLIAAFMYVILFFAAPFIGEFYNIENFHVPFRAIALVLFPGAFNSVQIARLARSLKFRINFLGKLCGVIVSGIIGLVMAYFGFGIWSLVMQQILNVTVASICMCFLSKWKIARVVDLRRVNVLFRYGWKLLVSGLLSSLYNEIALFLIGKRYSPEALAFYDRGKKFPQIVISSIYYAIQAVTLPVISLHQDDKTVIKYMIRRLIKTSCYIVFPMLVGMAIIAEPMIIALLTPKWLASVQILQILCFFYIFFPIHAANLQAMNAIGRTDMYLKLEIIKDIISLIFLIATIVLFDTVLAMAISMVIYGVINLLVNMYPNKKFIDYGIGEQIKDILPIGLKTAVMGGVVVYVGSLIPNIYLRLLLQPTLGIMTYIAISVITKDESFGYIMNVVNETYLKQRRKKHD